MRSALYSSVVWELTTEGERLFHCGIVRGKIEFFRASLYVWVWGQHISEISSKATKTLGFLRRNLAFAPKSTKEVAFKTLVRPKLHVEYAAPIWSPYSKLQINQVEKVQRTAARWTCRRWRTQVVSARCLMSLSGPLLRPVGIGLPCLSFIHLQIGHCVMTLSISNCQQVQVLVFFIDTAPECISCRPPDLWWAWVIVS